MTLLVNRGDLRTDLQIDPKKKIWGDSTLDRYLNEGQRWLINDPAVDWQFQESIGYLVPNQAYQEYRPSPDDDPETFMSSIIKKLIKARASTGGDLSFGDLPSYTNSVSSAPGQLVSFAQRFFLNAGYQEGAVYTTIHNMDSFDGNGTWIGSNDATTVATSATSKEGAGSVSFSIDVSNSALNKVTLTNSDLTTVELTDELNNGGFILWVNLPSATNIKAFEIVWGDDATNNLSAKSYEKDVQGKRYAAGWNRIFIPTLNRRKTGTPTTSIDYLQLNITYASDEADQALVLVDNIQYVDKYIEYFYSRKAEDMVNDSDESTVPSEYQYVYELYGKYRAFRKVRGMENDAKLSFNEAMTEKNRMIEELQYNIPRTFQMPPKHTFNG